MSHLFLARMAGLDGYLGALGTVVLTAGSVSALEMGLKDLHRPTLTGDIRALLLACMTHSHPSMRHMAVTRDNRQCVFMR
ncbi:uncharacterized protein PHACADRAFT_265283 [Phanerochaete carnosa HHB-10118-sp]|uniref:Uncharacterized protein n=1 Tax=Phanerochaete carnosa (strain HHB-10118-sp) TaxID=650164 RepID=K5UJG1_PHACS|nr:uncharacterized protein PHACADRAFT_265283 [Phanerochaete carnosa HHB-10118-sp]EKM49701.1 hypothetical protein PHACADRAFT_265283 [Phanerochaete carnosa HHB-10118-sp]